MTLVSFEQVELALGGRKILSGVDLRIPPKSFVGVLGANGAGKTTLMRAILGLVTPETGLVRVDGAPATRGNPNVGYMPQSQAALPRFLRGRDFLAAAINGHRWGLPVPGRDGARDVDRVLDLVGGTSLAARKLSELSGGERQRLLLAQSLLGSPGLLLLDEPLMSLDPHRQAEVVALVRELQTELGLTVLFSAHELNPLLGALDLVLYLGGGKAALGPMEAVITGPVLSRLYGAPIEVVHVGGRIFVMAGAYEIGRDDHQHGAHAHA